MKIVYLNQKNISDFQTMIPDPVLYNDNSCLWYGAYEEDCPAGIVCFKPDTPRAALKWIYVAEEYRRRGIGRTLMDHLIRALDKTGVSAIYFEEFCPDEGVRGFFEKQGFFVQEETGTGRVKVEDIKSRGVLDRAPGGPAQRIYPVSNDRWMDPRLIREFAVKSGYDVHGYSEKNVCREASFIGYDEDQEVDSVLVTSKYGDYICADFLCSASKSRIRPLQLLYCLQEYALKEKVEYIYYFAANEKVTTLVDLLTDGATEPVRGICFGVYLIKN